MGIFYIRQSMQALNDPEINKNPYDLQEALELGAMSAMQEMNQSIFLSRLERQKVRDPRNVGPVLAYLIPVLELQFQLARSTGNKNGSSKYY